MDETFLVYDQDKLEKILDNCPYKTNEKITQDVLEKNGDKIFFKDFNELLGRNNQFNLSDKTSKDSMDYWTVPFYDTKEDIVRVIVWNNKDDNPINVNFIINGERLVSFNNVGKFGWEMKNIGDINEIDSILILVNGRIKTNITLNDENKEIFKGTNYTQYEE